MSPMYQTPTDWSSGHFSNEGDSELSTVKAVVLFLVLCGAWFGGMWLFSLYA